MDEIRLSEFETENIISFLTQCNIKTNPDLIKNMAIMNMLILGASILFSLNKLGVSIIVIVFSIVIVSMLIYFMKKVEHNKKNFCFYYGVYLCMLSISLDILSYQFVQRAMGTNTKWFIILYVGMCGLMSAMSWNMHRKKFFKASIKNQVIFHLCLRKVVYVCWDFVFFTFLFSIVTY